MILRHLQTTFAGGEIAPELYGRTELARYANSARSLKNMIPTAQGPAKSRPGTYYVAATKDTVSNIRLCPFVFSNEDAFILEFGAGYVRFYKDGGQIQSAGSPYEVSTPYASGEVDDLKFAQSADTLYIVHKDHQPRTLQRVADDNWNLDLYEFENGPFKFPNTDTSNTMTLGAYTGTTSLTAAMPQTFTPEMVGGLWQLTHYVPSNKASLTSTGNNTSPEIKGHGTWRLTTDGTWQGTVYVEANFAGSAGWTIIRSFKTGTNDVNFNQTGEETDDGTPISFRVRSEITSGTMNAHLTTDPYTQVTVVKLTAYSSSQVVDVLIQSQNLDSAATITATFDWARGAWSDDAGWPVAVTFCQDRLVFGSNEDEPQNVWMTRTSEYTNFKRNDPLQDDDGLTVPLASRVVNKIRSLHAFQSGVVAFTAASNWTVGSDAGGALTPTTVFTKLHESRGSANVDPIIVGNRLIFVEPNGSAVRDMQFQQVTETLESEDISVWARHLFVGHSIIYMAFQQEPDNLIWAVREDGVLLSCTYMREQEVLAWSHHETEGTFEGVAVIPGDDCDEAWFVVRRGSSRFIERMTKASESTEPEDQYFVDCGISYDGVSTATLTGYDHLDGFSVAINAGGFVLPNQTVSAGEVSLGDAVTVAHVGLGYEADLETLDPVFPLREGSSQGRPYKVNQIGYRFLNTVGGAAGPDEDNLDDIDVRDESVDADDPTPLFTGWYHLPIPGPQEDYGHTLFRQSDPMPVSIQAISTTVELGDAK